VNIAYALVIESRLRQDVAVDTTWMARGKCKDVPPDTFFPSDGVGVEVARRICADCPVKAPCLEYAMENHIDHGVWGGTSERERRRIARRRRLAAAQLAN
jgi:WhiB family redox-sensing transcriptional regulator